jgi:hopanoid biosynthesis associated protein HpnK
MKKRFIVNADDFGLCSGVNQAIQKAHTDGILTSTTIMAGADGTDEALEMARQMPLLGVGIHLNLVEGKALCQNRQAGCVLDENGEFRHSAGKIALMSVICPNTRRAIENELAAQIESLLEKGLKPTHFDSHKHVHTFPSIYRIVVRLARRFGVGAVRWPYEKLKTCSSGWPLPSKNGKRRTQIIQTMSRINRWQDNSVIKNDAFYGIAHTGKADDEFWKAVCENAETEVAEVMTHPGYLDGLDPEKTRLIDERVVELEALCSESTKKAIADAGVELIHYGVL